MLFRSTTEKVIAERYRIGDEIEWVVQDGDNIFPHFIGAVSFEVELPVIRIFNKNI